MQLFSEMNTSNHNIFNSLGPGILLAAAAVGVSHLVQSTRAGADYGFALAGIIIVSCILKYPAFRFGNEYAAATGETLIDNYRRQGWWAIALFVVVMLGSMFVGAAAVGLVSAGLVKTVFALDVDSTRIASILLIACGAVLILGNYRGFERLIKILVALFTVAILCATALALPALDRSTVSFALPAEMDIRTILFIVALAGWMPAPLDGSILQSVWTTAKGRVERLPSVAESRLDFHIGYGCALFLALCFLTLGASIMHTAGIEFAATAGAFTGQVIGLFTQTIGEWTRSLIGFAALAVILSTLMTILDGYPRGLEVLVQPGRVDAAGKSEGWVYTLLVGVLVCGAIVLLSFFMKSFKAFIDLTASISFCTAPLIALLNHRAMMSPNVAAELRPRRWLWLLSVTGIVVLGSFALFYVYLLAYHM